MLSDKETDIDTLGFRPFVDSFSEIITEKGITPFTMGIFGSWGTGKTSLMLMLKRKLESSSNVKTVWFNAWKFNNEEQIWTALIQTILDQLEISYGKKVIGLIRELRNRVEWVQLLTFLGNSVISGKPDLDSLRESFKFREKIKSISEFEEKFEELVTSCSIERLVIFIDDLDRCRMDATVDILEAIKLLLNSKNCVYVLGLDYERTCDAISEKFAKNSRLIAENYLEKIIQLTFHIPRRSEKDMKLYLRYLFALRYLEEKNVKEFAADLQVIEENIDEEFLKLLKSYVNNFSTEEYEALTEYDVLIIKENEFNPRKLKRFLNTYELRRSFSKTFRLDLENKHIINFLLLQTKFSDFYRDLERDHGLLAEMVELIHLQEEEMGRRLEKSEILRKHYSNNRLGRFLREVSFRDIDDISPYLKIAETAEIETVIGEEEEEILEELMSPYPTKRNSGLQDFHEISRRKREKIIKKLFNKTGSHDPLVRKDSLFALGNIGLGDEGVEDLIDDILKKLVEKTDDTDASVRDIAVQALGQLREVIPESLIYDVMERLVEKTGDENESVRGKSLKALGNLGETIPENLMNNVVEAVIEGTNDNSESVREYAIQTLGGMKEVIPKNLLKSVVEKLIEKTEDNRFFLREKAIQALGNLGEIMPDDLMNSAVEKLIEKMDDKNVSVGGKAVEVLKALRTFSSEKLGKTIDKALEKDISTI